MTDYDFRDLFWAGLVVGVLTVGVLSTVAWFLSGHLRIGWSW